MGRRGPPPTPSPILKARGTYREDRRHSDEVAFTSTAPSCPSFLGKEAKAEWKRQCKELEAAGVLQVVDRAALAMWCEAWGEFRRLVETIEARLTAAQNRGQADDEDDEPDAVPLRVLRARDRAVDRLLRLAGQFGFTPAARTRIRTGDGLGGSKGGEEEGGSGNSKSRFFGTVG